ncbi:MAG: DUF3656 domain-containing protein [Bacteroidales bacterium]|nr:DUF3656 domain-containing protein [Bacteroidales bacterium]MBR5018934.1 DUF3656 domain-containing protein [Bacteroidales bacterium]
MQISLELLAPARNAEIGIAAIDCGADAVYIAGPAFGARAAAGNPVDEIARLCRHAHLYGAKIHATVNTLLQGGELQEALDLMWALYEAGVDVFIIQDLQLLEHPLPPVELHASTQTAIRTPERARDLAALGFSRLVLERQLSLDEIRAIRAAVPASCELEFFIHGALCVGYSGECYLSQYLTGRSANRGVCAQACRSRYDLVDADGRVLVRDRSLLSPKDLRFDARLADLVAAGITSFKIEGRLKNASYVKNVVRHYRNVIDQFIASSAASVMPGTDRASDEAGTSSARQNLFDAVEGAWHQKNLPLHQAIPQPASDAPVMPGAASVMPGLTGHLYRRASAGRVEGGFTPDPDRTFGRGWTEAFLDGRRASLQSVDAAKALGEYIGEIVAVHGRTFEVETDKSLANGDGLSFVPAGGAASVVGGRAELAQGRTVTLREPIPLLPGTRVYRNFDVRFERELEKNMPKRVLDVAVEWRSGDARPRSEPRVTSESGLTDGIEPGVIPESGLSMTIVTATSQGVTVEKRFIDEAPLAEKPEAALDSLRRQLSKNSGPFAFSLDVIEANPVRFYSAAFLNSIRRDLAVALQERLESRRPSPSLPSPLSPGPDSPRPVLHTPIPGAAAHNVSTLDIPAELLRTRYCIRRELGLCKRFPVKPGMTLGIVTPGMTQQSVTPGMTDTRHPRPDRGSGPAQELYLVNQKNRLRLVFDCARCEMAIMRCNGRN